ncbi:hypothetical protein MBLNU230_g1594t1 [Neophaeotheca triangularis]
MTHWTKPTQVSRVFCAAREGDQSDFTFERRNASKTDFFSTSSYRGLERNIAGIKALRDGLCKLFFRHLEKELPHLEKELAVKQMEVAEDLVKLGKSPSSYHDQQRYLMDVSNKYQANVMAATKGDYERGIYDLLGTDTTRYDTTNFC